MKNTLTIIFFLLLFQFSFGQEYTGDQLSATFTSEAKLSSFDGNSTDLKGLFDLKQNLIDFYLDLNTIETGIKLRDKHMRNDYLETKQYPYAEFSASFSESDLKKVQSRESGEYILNGSFSVHGVEKEKEVSIKIEFKNQGQEIYFSTAFSILLTEHNIKIPKVMFYELSNNINIKTHGLLYLQN